MKQTLKQRARVADINVRALRTQANALKKHEEQRPELNSIAGPLAILIGGAALIIVAVFVLAYIGGQS